MAQPALADPRRRVVRDYKGDVIREEVMPSGPPLAAAPPPGGGALAPGAPMAAAPAGGGLQPTPTQSTVPPPAPAPAMGAQAQPAAPAPGGPALGGQPNPEEQIKQIDPDTLAEIGNLSAEAARNTAPADKQAINTELESTFGEGSIEKSFEDILKRVTAARVAREGDAAERDDGRFAFSKLSKEDKGLFLMDFGMRLMAHSGQWNAQLGGAIGQAGSEALAGAQDKYAQDYALTEEARRYENDQQRSDEALALDLTQLGTPESVKPPSPQFKAVLNEKGELVYRDLTGQYPGDHAAPPEAALSGTGRLSARRDFEEMLRGGGLYNAAAAADIAAGSPTPSEVYQRTYDKATDAFDKLDGYTTVTVIGEDGEPVSKKRKDVTMEERARFLRTEAARVKREFEIVQNRERQAGPALQQTPPPGTPQTPPGATTPALQDGQEPPPPQPTDDRWGL